MSLDILITIVSVSFIVIFGAFSSKLYINEKTKSLVPLGVDFAEELKEKTNKEKLVKAISFIEVSLLNLVPAIVRPFLDYLINSEEIATYIERYLTKRKLDGYKNDNEENE